MGTASANCQVYQRLGEVVSQQDAMTIASRPHRPNEFRIPELGDKHGVEEPPATLPEETAGAGVAESNKEQQQPKEGAGGAAGRHDEVDVDQVLGPAECLV